MELSIDALSEWIRRESGLDGSVAIGPETQFERDLGITGDEATSLMQSVERHFDVPMSSVEGGYRRLFGLHEGEYLFWGEGLGLLALIPSKNHVSVRAFTVGELFQGLVSARELLNR